MNHTPGQDAGPPPRRLPLDRGFTEAVTNLIIDVGTHSAATAAEWRGVLGAALAARPDDRAALVDGLTRCIADLGYLEVYLDHLAAVRRPWLPCEDDVPDERVERLLRRGPAALSDGELAYLTLATEQIEALREELDTRMTRFWVDAIDAAMDQAARDLGEHRTPTAELVENVLRRYRRRTTKPRRREAVMLDTMGDEPVVGPTVRSDNYVGEHPPGTQVAAVVSPMDDGFELRFLGDPGLSDAELRWTSPRGAIAAARHDAGGFRFRGAGRPRRVLDLDVYRDEQRLTALRLTKLD